MSTAQSANAHMVSIDQGVEVTVGQVIALTRIEQLAFWTALDQPIKLTLEQKKLGKIMRGES